MSKFLILLVLVCTVLECSVARKSKKRGGGCGGKKLQKNIKAYNKCLEQGFPSSLGCESSGTGKIKGKLLKRCKKVEKKLKKCAYSCEDEAGWEFRHGTLLRLDKESGDIVFGNEGLVALLFVKDDKEVMGTLCGDFFNDHAANLLCQYLGYDNAASWGSHGDYRYIAEAFIKQVKVPIVVDDVKCGPDDSIITDCDAKIMDHNCGHDKDVWLKCSGEDSSPDWEFLGAELLHVEEGGTDVIPGDEGLVALIFANGSNNEPIMGTLCGDFFNDHAANLLCQYLGYDKATSWGSHGDYKYVPKALIEEHDVPIVVDDVKCGPEHSNITDCDVTIMDHNCDHDKDVWLKCGSEEGGSGELPCMETSRQVELESLDFAYAEQPLPGEILEIKLIEQNSDAACQIDESFGIKGHVVWVDSGCRGIFDVKTKVCAVHERV